MYKRQLKACTNGSSELMTNLSASLVGALYNWQLLRLGGADGDVYKRQGKMIREISNDWSRRVCGVALLEATGDATVSYTHLALC